MSPSGLSAQSQAHLVEGIRRFNAGLFWEAHEAWEEAWLDEEGLVKRWFQALIQLTAAFHKGLRMNHPAGMVRLFEQAAEKLESLQESGTELGGLSTTLLLALAREGCEQAERWLDGGPHPWSQAPLPQLPLPTLE